MLAVHLHLNDTGYKMARTYKKKRTPPQTHSPATVLQAVKAVKVGNKSIRHVSENMKIPYQTLTRYCHKVHPQQLTENRKVSEQVFKRGDIAGRRVFSSVQERDLVALTKKAIDSYNGMTARQVRHLAYEAAVAFRCNFPESWKKTQQAGYDWFIDFIQRHRELADGTEDASLLPISTPSCSKTENPKVSEHVYRRRDIAAKSVFSSVQERDLVALIKKAMGTYYGMTAKQGRHLAYEAAVAYCCDFPVSWKKTQQAGYKWFQDFIQRHRELAEGTEDASLLPISTPSCSKTINHYFKHFKLLHDSLNLEAENIWCMGEIAVSTLPRSHRVFGRCGTRPETRMALCSGGESAVTMALFVSASGASIPPFLVVPPVSKNGASFGTLGSSNTSEWLGKYLFLVGLKHFVQHTAGCLRDQTLLLIDGHLSYVSIKAIEFCKLNGIILLAFPQHYCNTLNPLHRTLIGSVKSHINTSWDSWRTSHSDMQITVEHIPKMISPALTHITSDKIKEAFNEAGIYPLSNSLSMLVKFKKKVTASYSETENRNTAALWDKDNMDHRKATREAIFINYEEEEMDMNFAEQEDPLGDVSTVDSSRTHENVENSSQGHYKDIKAEAQEVEYNSNMITLPHYQSFEPSCHSKNTLYISTSEKDFIKTKEVNVENGLFEPEEVKVENDFFETEEVKVENDFFETEEVKVENNFFETEEVQVENYLFTTDQIKVEKDFFKTDQVNNKRDFIKIEEVKVEVKEEDIDDAGPQDKYYFTKVWKLLNMSK